MKSAFFTRRSYHGCLIGLSVAGAVISALIQMADGRWDLGVLAVSAGVFAVLTLVLGLVTLVLYISYLGDARDSF